MDITNNERMRLAASAYRAYIQHAAQMELPLDEDDIEDDILADLIEKVPTKSIGTGQFVIGTSKVRPRLNEAFKRDEKMGLYMQLYNFSPDEKTQKPSGEISYEIGKIGSTEKVLDFTEDISKIPNASASQVTVEKLLSLKTMAPGAYTLKVTATDKKGNQTLQQQTNFTVN